MRVFVWTIETCPAWGMGLSGRSKCVFYTPCPFGCFPRFKGRFESVGIQEGLFPEHEEEEEGVGELAAERFQPAGEEAFDGVDGDVELVGGFLVFFVVDDDGGDDFAGLFGEGFDGLADVVYQFGGDGHGFFFRKVVMEQVGFADFPAVAPVVEAGVFHAAEEVGGERVRCHVEEGFVFDEAVEDVLHEVFRHVASGEEGVGKHDEGFVVPFE